MVVVEVTDVVVVVTGVVGSVVVVVVTGLKVVVVEVIGAMKCSALDGQNILYTLYSYLPEKRPLN